MMWYNVRRGEKMYISPFKNRANIIIDSSLPYEPAVFANYADVLGKAVDDLGADMSKSLSHFTRDLVAAVTVVGLWPLSIPLLILS